MSKPTLYRSRFALAAMLCLLLSTSARAADGDFGLSIVFAYGPYYTVDRWLPVRAIITNRSAADVHADVVIPIKGEDGTVTFRMPVTIPAKSNSSFGAYIYVPTLPPPPPPRKGAPTPEPPISLAYLESTDPQTKGAQLVRSEMLGRLIKETDRVEKSQAQQIPLSRSLILAATDDQTLAETITDQKVNSPSDFADMFVAGQGGGALQVFAQPIGTTDLPRNLAGYDSVAIIVMSGVPLQKLDAAQRQAILDFMTTGGTVLLAAPRGDADPTGTWLAPYLPAAYVGQRFTTSMKLGTATTRPVVPCDVAEFVVDDRAPAGSKIVVGDEQYVHLAYTPVGYGRLAVSSFPVTTFDPKNPAIRALWAQTVVTPEATLPWDKSEISTRQNQLMKAMVGLKAPPWMMAAGIVGAYVLIVLVIQLVARQSLRPMGFAAAIGAAILIAGGLLLVSLFKDKTVALSAARISVTDLETGGMRHEAVGLLGDEDVAIQAVPGAALRDEIGGSSDVTLITSPPGARSRLEPRQLGHIWQATAAVPMGQSLKATGMFDAEGLKLSIDNTAGPIVAPLLLTEGRHFSLADIPLGQSTGMAADQNLNPTGSAINSKALQLEAEQLRGRIMDAVMKPSNSFGGMSDLAVDPPLVLAGWYAEAPAPLVTLGGEAPKTSQVNAMIRTRVAIQPSPVGSTVKINGAFTRIMNGQGGTIPFDTNKREWIPQFTAPQEFQIGFAVPPGIGRLKPNKVTLMANFNAGQHTVTVRRGQCPDGKPDSNPAGPLVATWVKPLSAQTVTFDVTPGDYDANGWVWLLFKVDSEDVGTIKWQINGMNLGYEATVDGPPMKPVMPLREALPPPPPPPRQQQSPPKPKETKPKDPKPAPKPDPKKPAPDPKKDAPKK